MSWAEHLIRMEDRRGAYRILVRRPEGTRPLRKAWRRWKDNIKVDLLEVGWIELTQNKNNWRTFVNAVMKFKAIEFVSVFISKYLLYYTV
jgi:hypothetical protein